MHNKITKGFVLAAAVLTASPALAGTDFGSDGEVREVVAKFSAFVKSSGTDAAVKALRDKTSEFATGKPGVMIWVDNKMGGHSKYPDLSGVDFSTLQDLRGRFVIKEFSEAADKGGDYSLNYWPHYTNETEYEYHCFSTWVDKPKVMITACR